MAVYSNSMYGYGVVPTDFRVPGFFFNFFFVLKKLRLVKLVVRHFLHTVSQSDSQSVGMGTVSGKVVITHVSF